MADIGQIRRTYDKPDFEGKLYPGELGYSFLTNQLFIGSRNAVDPDISIVESSFSPLLTAVLSEFTDVSIVIE